MSAVAPAQAPVPLLRRSLLLGLVLVLIALGLVANSTMKRHRAALRTGENSAVATVDPTKIAQSTAWYCAGPLPLGLKREQSSLVISNASTTKVSGQLLLSTSRGLSTTKAISVSPRSNAVFPLGGVKHSSFGAASVLVNGSGIGVEEVVDGPTGREAAACATRSGSSEYLAGGSTSGANDVALAIYDPSATPAVANVEFVTSSGDSQPQSLQGLPVGAGDVTVVDVAHAVAQRQVVATIVQSTGGKLIVGAIEKAAAGSVVAPSLVTGQDLAESSWYLPATPAGGSTVGYLYALNPNGSSSHAVVTFDGSAGTESANVLVPANGVARLTLDPASSSEALRGISLTSSGAPLVVLQSSLLTRPLTQSAAKTSSTSTSKATPTGPTAPKLQKTGASSQSSTAAAVPAGIAGLPTTLPSGFAVMPGTVESDDWMLPGGVSDSSIGEYVTITDPGTKSTDVTVETLGDGEADVIPDLGSILLQPGEAIAVDLSKVLGSTSSLSLLASSTEPVVVGAGLYAKGSGSSVGLSEPVAIPIN